MKRSVALVCLFAAVLVACGAREAAAQKAAGASKVTVTLVRWPYT